MSRFTKFASFAGIGLFLLATVGCGQSPALDAKTLEGHRTRLVLTEEPDGILTVADVRVALLGEEHDPHAGHDHGEKAHDEHDHEEGHDEHAHAEHSEHEEHAHDEEIAHEGHDHKGHDHGEDEHAHHATESIDVNMVGHIGGLANPWAGVQKEYPFAKKQAVFFLADPQAIVENEASGHAHAPGEECVFCAANAADQKDMLAMVQFVDKNGKVLPVDVRLLFDVKEQDTVVVRGKAHVTEGGILVVDAQGLYIRK